MLERHLERLAIVHRSSWSVASLALFAACSSSSLHEDSTGYVDLVPFYRAGATTADPTAGLPRIIAPSRGWIDGARVEYYDLSPVTLPRKTGSRGEELRVPDAPTIREMYFFFDSQGRPLFSKPGFDPLSNSWFMPGGKKALDPAPIASPATEAERQAYYATPYVIRPHAELMDELRGSSNYQRPVIDALPGDSDYTGVWQVVEITVKSSEYEADDVKSGKKVREGLADGGLSERKTGLVINCAVVDERTRVLPSAMNSNIPRPRIEIWYRTKLGNCFLANGWETIGETIDGTKSAGDRGNLRLFSANDTSAARFSTLDVVSENAGDEVGARITVPVAKMFAPVVAVPLRTPAGDVRRVPFPGDDLATALPRRVASDPPGYSPIVWIWDINVPQAPPYVAGSIRTLADLAISPDPFPPANPTLGGAVEARDGATGVVARNIAVIGAATKCSADSDCKFGQQCNQMPDPSLATTEPPPGQNIADVVIQREGSARCDVPATGFGGYCSPGVARCDVQAVANGENETKLKALGVASAGPTFTAFADEAAAYERLSDAKSLAMGVDPGDPMRVVPDAERTANQAAVADLETAATQAADRVAYYQSFGFTKDLNGWGYFCYPGGAGAGTGSGFCAIRCDSTASGTVTEVKSQITVPEREPPIEYTFRTEPRCGGTNLLGYRCLPTGTLPAHQRVCLRECNRQVNTSAATYVADPAPTLAFNRALCDHPLNVNPDGMGNPSTAFALSSDMPPITQLIGQECAASSLTFGSNATTVRACSWNVDFAPRDPTAWAGN